MSGGELGRSQSMMVIGSGAAGLSAALAGQLAGATVVVVERDARIGGTTALSGGNAWLPANRFVAEDTPKLALTYLRALSLGDVDDSVLEAFAYGARETADWLEHETPIEWQPIPYSDYHAEFPGGRAKGGRTLEPQPLLPAQRVSAMVRPAPNVTAPITYAELAGREIDREALAERRRAA